MSPDGGLSRRAWGIGLSEVARRTLRAAMITTLASVTAFGADTTAAGAAGLARAGAVGSVPSSPLLAGVSCPTLSMCMIVGEADGAAGFVPLAAIWNGRTWRWMAQPPERQPNSGLGAVTCLSATRCIAIGTSDATDSTGKGVAFGEEWNGATWRRLPPMAGVTFTEAHSVSCVTAAYCMAVGGSDHPGQLGNAIAEFWNGASWTEMTPVIPAGATRITFDSVSCPSRSHCLAVGSFRIHIDEFALAESWNGSTWTMRAAPPGIQALAGVSCPRPRLCLAVGPGPAAALWNGSRWHRLTTPKPGGFQPSLGGVSCASAARCIAVGASLFPFADAWTGGTSLRRLKIPDRAGQLPGLYGVSCSRSTSCLAVGSPIGEFSAGGNVAIAWNGSRWRVIRENKSDVLAGVSCPASSDCLAVGGYLNKSDAFATLAQHWRGKAWRLANPPGVLGEFTGISCASRSFCMAAGVDRAATWNGSRWKVLTAGTGNLGVSSVVSCGSPRLCAATGDPFGMAVWNGVKWRDMNFALPAGSATGELAGVSCTSKSFCVAVGSSSVSFEGEPPVTLANIWNGRTWRLVSTPHPGLDSLLSAISCLPRSGCMAVGNYVDADHTGHNLAIRFSGGKWRVVKMPGGFGFIDPGDPASITGPSSVSCSRAASCVAVGSYPGAGGSLRELELAEVWNGTAWRLTTPAGPASGLASVSCAEPTSCMAVGQDGNLALTERWNGRAWRLLTEANP